MIHTSKLINLGICLVLSLSLIACQAEQTDRPESESSIQPTAVLSEAAPGIIPDIVRDPPPSLTPIHVQILPTITTLPGLTATQQSEPTNAPLPMLVPTSSALPASEPEPTTMINSEPVAIGRSVQDRPIEVYRMGNGPIHLVLIGSIHGAHECNVFDVVSDITKRILAEPTLVPAHITLHTLPKANPDGCSADTRTNAHNVDLNRNFAAGDWAADAQGPRGLIPGSGGVAPFSEPETAAIRDWLIGLREELAGRPLRVISFHSAVAPNGLVQPGYRQTGVPEPVADELAKSYSKLSGYTYSPIWVGSYIITGEFIRWAAENNVIAIDIELPDGRSGDSIPAGRNETHNETNFRSVMALFEVLKNPYP